MKEFTIILIKNNAIKRKLIGKVITILEEKNLEIKRIKSFIMTKEILNKFYSKYLQEVFFIEIERVMLNKKIIFIELLGPVGTIEFVRKILGNILFYKNDLSTIRGRFSIDTTDNIMHASDSIESANKELKILEFYLYEKK